MIKDKYKFSVLVIEDNAGDFTLVEDYLLEQINEPFIVHAANFGQALSILTSGTNNFDVILLDLNLPDKGGQQLVTEMLNIALVCPIIILTGFSDVQFSINSISQGISDYLLKDDLNASSLYKSIIYCRQRRKQLLETEASEKRYSNLFHLSPQPMWVNDLETLQFLQVNKAAIENYGYSEKEFLSMTLDDLAPEEEDITDQDSKSQHAGRNEPNFMGRFKHYKKTGEQIDVDIYSNPIVIDNRKCQSVIAIDVTEKIHFEYKITRAIIKTQEDERYEIGAELHDNVCQILASSLMSLGMLKKSLEPASMENFNKSSEYIKLATAEIRDLSHRLAPAFFNDSTLEEAFQRVLQVFNAEDKYKIYLFVDKAVKKFLLDRYLKLNLYRILQEQLNNIFKYAHATTIKIDVVIHKNKLRMQISDNGVGFDPLIVKRGIGLSNMTRRAELFFGKLDISTAEGSGCEIIVEIPFQEPASTTEARSPEVLSPIL